MRKFAIRAALLPLAFVAATAAHAQAAKMYGVVTDDAGQGVPDVKVVLEPVEAGAKVQVASKGKKGAYFFGLIRPGTYTMKVDSPGNALQRIKAQATVSTADKGAEWNLDCRVDPANPPKLKIVDGMSITCDITVGKAVAMDTGSGTASVTADQAYRMIAQQVQGGDCAGAGPKLEAFIAANPSNGHAYYLKGYCAAVVEDNDAAVAALQKSLELEPGFPGTRTLLGKVLLRQGKHAEAETVFRHELETSASAAPELRVDTWMSLAGALREQKKTEDAIAAYEKAIETAPNRPEAYVELSGLYADAGQVDKADAVLVRAKDAGADDPKALLHVAISSFNKKDAARAEALCKRVIDGGKAANPDLASAHAILGRIQLSDGRIDQGVASLKKSLELDPEGRFAAQSQEILTALKKK